MKIFFISGLFKGYYQELKSLIKANGLRNRLVYHYNKLSDKMAFESIKKLLGYLIRFIEVVEKWMMRELEK